MESKNTHTKTHRKRDQIRFVVMEGGGENLEEGGQKTRITSYKLNKYYIQNIHKDNYR